MALPIVWLGAGLLGAAFVADSQAQRRQLEQRRRWDENLDRKQTALTLPSEWHSGLSQVAPEPGSLVACHVYGVVEHTGIWLGEGHIAELHGSGLIRGVSEQRFLSQRSGKRIFVCCNRYHQPIRLSEDTVTRASSTLYQVKDYHLFENNCHRYVYWALTGENRKVRDFSQLNCLVSAKAKQPLFWDLCQRP
ncbi:hypothetical protein [Paraferrimonas haliotis]|uniref:Lecithin retinol acyltransferase n=1 Tax=Paraferrimonas haliotis TaxID=2013866 RepID=A0AA37TUE6_9GAMM|nr:hypothetical protein [Paraferrimonas haliotis]GLS84391.1 hypothetical protein GCM10007894_23680 [Paraferrimonas haliotis]